MSDVFVSATIRLLTIHSPVGEAILSQLFPHVSHKDSRVGKKGVGAAYGHHELVESTTDAVGGEELSKHQSVGGHLAQVAHPALGGLQVWCVEDELLPGMVVGLKYTNTFFHSMRQHR